MKNSLASFFNNLFGVSSKEIRGILVLVFLIVAGLLIVKVYKANSIRSLSLDAYDQTLLDSLVSTISPEVTVSSVIANDAIPIDPNSCNSSELQKIGLSIELANRIIKYRNAGGSFTAKSDLLKIYGMSDSVFNVVSQYILLPDREPKLTSSITKKATKKNKDFEHVKFETFDINEADTAQLRKIYGIGPILSMRIVSFRDKLGGFVNPAQLREVYNLDSIVVIELLNHIFVDPGFIPKKLSINEMDRQQLASHPYLSANKARLIVAYREQHGEFLDIKDITKVYSIDSVVVKKLGPYIVF